jgi:DNA polymerase III epsilon subunit-like protein
MKVTVFDTETTGLIINPARKLDAQPEIVSIAILKIDLYEAKMEDMYYKLFKPSKSIPQHAFKIHGISDEDVKNCPRIYHHLTDEIIPLFEESNLIIGQNINFDMSMVDLECKRYSRPIKWPKALDLVENSIFLQGYRLSLIDLHIELFGKEFEGAHKADTDVRITAKCAIEMYKRRWL